MLTFDNLFYSYIIYYYFKWNKNLLAVNKFILRIPMFMLKLT